MSQYQKHFLKSYVLQHHQNLKLYKYSEPSFRKFYNIFEIKTYVFFWRIKLKIIPLRSPNREKPCSSRG